jgi:hypothetical protein
MYSTPEDQALYLECVKGLPTLAGFSGTGRDENDVPIPYGVGPHSVRCIREVCEIVQPKSILEIGFNLGYSASLWLHFTSATLFSVDISNKRETLAAATTLTERYPDRFTFLCCDSFKLLPRLEGKKFDLIFIDGGHLDEHVMNDIRVAQALDIPNLCFDDWLPQFGPGVQPSIARYKLTVAKVMGNIALAKWK